MPHLFDQLIFFEQTARVLDKDEQNVEYAARQRHLFAGAQAFPVRRIDLEIAEDVSMTVRGSSVSIAVSVFQIFSNSFPKIRRTRCPQF